MTAVNSGKLRLVVWRLALLVGCAVEDFLASLAMFFFHLGHHFLSVPTEILTYGHWLTPLREHAGIVFYAGRSSLELFPTLCGVVLELSLGEVP